MTQTPQDIQAALDDLKKLRKEHGHYYLHAEHAMAEYLLEHDETILAVLQSAAKHIENPTNLCMSEKHIMKNQENYTGTRDIQAAPPLMPRFGLGDIVTVTGEYAGDWRNQKLMIVGVLYEHKRDLLTYSTVPADAPLSEGMTTDWYELSLSIYSTNKFNTRPIQSHAPSHDAGDLEALKQEAFKAVPKPCQPFDEWERIHHIAKTIDHLATRLARSEWHHPKLKDRTGRYIKAGQVVHWSDGGDDLPLENLVSVPRGIYLSTGMLK